MAGLLDDVRQNNPGGARRGFPATPGAALLARLILGGEASMRPATIPAFVGLGFGTVWMMIGVLGVAPAIQAASAILVLSAALVLAFVLVVRRPPPHGAAGPPPDRAWLRWSLGGEAAGIAAGLAYGIAAHRGDLVLPLVGIAVGLHFLPLAAAFRRPMLALAGLLVTLAALASTGFDGPDRLQVMGFGAGAAIWLTLLADRRPG